jgi:hypothetical protein
MSGEMMSGGQMSVVRNPTCAVTWDEASCHAANTRSVTLKAMFKPADLGRHYNKPISN